MTDYFGTNHVFTSRNSSANITLKAGVGETLLIEGALNGTGLTNNRALSGYYSLVPAATTLTVNTWTKMAGTTTVDSHNFKFTETDNRLTYTGTISGIFFISYSVALTGGNNNNIELGISKNGATPNPSSVIIGTTTSGGDLLPLAASCHIDLITGDYIECFVRNTTGSANITHSRLTVSVLGLF